MGKINVYDKIMIENQKKRKYGNQRNFLHKSRPNKWFSNGIHNELMPEGALTSFTVCDAYRYYHQTSVDIACQTTFLSSFRDLVPRSRLCQPLPTLPR